MSNANPPTPAIQEDDGPVKTYDVLDLYDLALLSNYERYAREPRFRRSKLVDVARGNDDFQVLPISLSCWNDEKQRSNRTGFIFKIEDNSADDEEEPDLPSGMLPLKGRARIRPSIQALKPRELETIFYQARTHDSCFATIALLQYLFDMYDDVQPLRVRTDTGAEYVMYAGRRHTATFTLHEPKALTVAMVCVDDPALSWRPDGSFQTPRGATYITGDEPSMEHCAMVFPPPTEDADLAQYIRGASPPGGVVLDLASMQFGDAGRGLRARKALFVLEPMDDFKARMLTVAARVDVPVYGSRKPERPELLWLKDVARRVKARYDRREKEHWCGHCGAPAGKFACRCHTAWYCDKAHQNAAWPFHKHYCSESSRTKAK